jgi:iron complex transport system substrate-binding protein
MPSSRRSPVVASLPALLGLLLLLLAACGDDGDTAVPQSGDRPETTVEGGDADPVGEGDFPVTVVAYNGEVTVESRPERIVSLSATLTEMLFAIDAGDQVVAVDSFSTYPSEAPVTDLAAYQVSVEAVAEHDPDLVVLSYDPGDVIEGLQLLGIPAILFDAAPDLDGVYEQIEVLGAANGNVGGGAELVARMRTELDEIVGDLPDHAAGLTYFHELDDTYYTVTSSTFVGQVYSLLGLVNIADAADPDGSSGGYPQLSEEFIIEADPQLVFLADADCCGQSPETVAARAGWGELRAVTSGGVIAVDESLSSRWGPRIVDFVRQVADAIAAYEPVG